MNSSEIQFTVFHVVYPTSEPDSDIFFSQKRIKKLFERYTTVKNWAMILHDRDVYTRIDESIDPNNRAGDPKPPHYHLIVRSNQYFPLKSLAKWLRIDPKYIQKPEKGGVKGFNIQLMYLTHTSDECKGLGKTEYSVSEIISNFDVRNTFNVFMANSTRRKKFDELRIEMITGISTMVDIQKKYPIEYLKYYEKLTSLEKKIKNQDKSNEETLNNRISIPDTRVNIVLCGPGGVGKSSLAFCTALCLYPNKNPDNIIFEASNKGSSLSGYKNQPIIDWDDHTGNELVNDLSGRRTVKRIFRIHPINEFIDVKHTRVRLINKYNLLSTYQKFDRFIHELHSEEDEDQYYRRFPMYVNLYEDYIEIFLEDQVLDSAKKLGSYSPFRKIRCSFKKLMKSTRNTETLRKVFSNILKSYFEAISLVNDYISSQDMTEEEVMELAEGYGDIEE